MHKFNRTFQWFRSLEDCSEQDTFFHRMAPLGKMIIVLCYLVVLLSFSYQEVFGLCVLGGVLLLAIALAEIPYRVLFSRAMIALPFVLFAGISNLIFWKDTAFYVGKLAISFGMVSCLSLILKTMFSVGVVLFFVATTPWQDLIHTLDGLKVPRILVEPFFLTYRYMSILVAEAGQMSLAYRLRSGLGKIQLKDMGSFLSQLILRSFARVDRVYRAMKCRGYGTEMTIATQKFSMDAFQWAITIFCCLGLVLLRFIPFGSWFF